MTYVRIALFCEKTGWTDRAVRRKCQDGVWQENKVWRRAPDGTILIAVEEYERWVEGEKGAA
jgi:hypothetical protein